MASERRRPAPDQPPGIGDLLLANLLNHPQLGIVALDRGERIRYWNAGAEEIFGLAAEAALGQPFTIVAKTLEQTDGNALLDASRKAGAWASIPCRRRSDGARLSLGLSITSLHANDVGDAGTLILARDATARLQAEALREGLAAIVDSSDDAIIGESFDGLITSWNSAAERILGYTAEEIIGRPVSLLLPPNRPEDLASTLWRIRSGESVDHYQTERLTKDGRILPVSITLSPIRDPAGNLSGASAIVRDISARLRAEASRDELAAIVESSDDAIIGESFDGLITSWNKGAERIFGYPATEIIGRPVALLLPPNRTDDLAATLWRIRAGDRVEQYRTERLTKDGRTLQVSMTLSPIRDAAGNLSGASAIARDISEQIRLENELRASNAQFEAVLHSSIDGITVLDLSGRMLYANAAAARMIGFDSVEALLAASRDETLSAFEIMREDGSPLPIEELPGRRALRGEYPPETVERYRILATGEERYSSVAARPVLDEDGRVLFSVTTFRDISQPYRDRQRFQFLDEATAVLASSLDYDMTLDRVARIAVPQFADWASVDILQADGTIKQVGLAHQDPARISWARELTARRPPDPNAPTGSAHVIRTGEAEFYPTLDPEELRAAATDEETRKILEDLQLTSALTVPMRARDRVIGALTLVQGESGRHYSEADLRFAQDLADRAAMAVDNARLYREVENALQIRDEFLSTISHDLRTPLTTIRGLTDLLMRQASRIEIPVQLLEQSLGDINRASRNMSRMIDELLDLSRIESGRPLTLNRERVDLALLVSQLIDEHQRTTRRHTIQLEAPADGLEGYWDPIRLERVMDNLLSNAIKYSPEGGTVSVSIAAIDDEPAGAQAEIRVADEGIGIPAGDLPRIFERHYRAGNVTNGMPGLGIGLAGVAQTVAQHGGRIYAESEEGRGSVFVVRLPIDADPPRAE